MNEPQSCSLARDNVSRRMRWDGIFSSSSTPLRGAHWNALFVRSAVCERSMNEACMMLPPLRFPACGRWETGLLAGFFRFPGVKV